MPKNFTPTPDQKRALALLAGPARKTLLFGGSRSGKTFILVYALLVRALREPGSRHIILRFHANAAAGSASRNSVCARGPRSGEAAPRRFEKAVY